MCWHLRAFQTSTLSVSVAGCLGYDVLVHGISLSSLFFLVSVAGCLGYDVLERKKRPNIKNLEFQLLVV